MAVDLPWPHLALGYPAIVIDDNDNGNDNLSESTITNGLLKVTNSSAHVLLSPNVKIPSTISSPWFESQSHQTELIWAETPLLSLQIHNQLPQIPRTLPEPQTTSVLFSDEACFDPREGFSLNSEELLQQHLNSKSDKSSFPGYATTNQSYNIPEEFPSNPNLIVPAHSGSSSPTYLERNSTPRSLAKQVPPRRRRKHDKQLKCGSCNSIFQRRCDFT